MLRKTVRIDMRSQHQYVVHVAVASQQNLHQWYGQLSGVNWSASVGE